MLKIKEKYDTDSTANLQVYAWKAAMTSNKEQLN